MHLVFCGFWQKSLPNKRVFWADYVEAHFKSEPEAFQPVWEKYNAELKKRAEAVYGKYDEPIRWNGDYYDNKLSPHLVRAQ